MQERTSMTKAFESEQLCQVIRQATSEVLASMFGLDMTAGEPHASSGPRANGAWMAWCS